jgi:hypothetical protein
MLAQAGSNEAESCVIITSLPQLAEDMAWLAFRVKGGSQIANFGVVNKGYEGIRCIEFQFGQLRKPPAEIEDHITDFSPSTTADIWSEFEWAVEENKFKDAVGFVSSVSPSWAQD